MHAASTRLATGVTSATRGDTALVRTYRAAKPKRSDEEFSADRSADGSLSSSRR